jgi:hypothetical protein
VQHDRAWRSIIALDESWFELTKGHEFIWLPQRENFFEWERHLIQSKESMLMIVWNPQGFSIINVLEKRRKFSVMHYVTESLSPFPNGMYLVPGKAIAIDRACG